MGKQMDIPAKKTTRKFTLCPGYVETATPNRIAPDEIFARVSEYLYPHIDPVYYVSTYGRVYNQRLQIFLTLSRKPSGKKYTDFLFTEYDEEGNLARSRRAIYVARVMLEMFKPIPEMQHMTPVYLDGNTENIFIENLEWNYTEYMIRKLARAEREDKQYQLELKRQREREAYERELQLMLQRKAEMEKAVKTNQLTYQQINDICKYYQDHPIDMFGKTVMQKTKYFIDMLKYFKFFGKENINGLIEICQNIYNRKIYVDIGNKYNF